MEGQPSTRPDLRHLAGATAAVFAVTLGLMVGLLHKGGDDQGAAKAQRQAQKMPTEGRPGTQQAGRRPAQKPNRAGARPVPGGGSSSGSPGPADDEPDLMFPADEGGAPIR